MNSSHLHDEKQKHNRSPGAFLPIASGDYSDIQQFFVREALLLDHHHYDEWSGLFARDVSYSARQSDTSIFPGSPDCRVLTRDFPTILQQIARLPSSKNAMGGTPKTHLRRFVSNLSVCFADCRDEFNVMSYILLSQYAKETGSTTILTAERRDRLRRRDRSFSITRREILFDQSVDDPFQELMLL